VLLQEGLVGLSQGLELALQVLAGLVLLLHHLRLLIFQSLQLQ
jgi:uncharacterized protein YhhL (DUF1145 family)